MNEFLRIIDRLLKKYGYAIKKHPQYNLLPLEDFKGFEDLKTVYSLADNIKEKKDKIDNLEICLRTCINDARTKNRVNELTKTNLDEHLLKCVNSLLVSINYAVEKGIEIKLTIFDDRSSKTAIDVIRSSCNNLNCEWRIITTEKTGQGESLYQHFDYARRVEALTYFCEDDYLHIQSAIYEMYQFYKQIYDQTGSHLLIHPQEHELIYSQFNYPSYILEGEKRWWRTMSHATHTFLTHSAVVKKYWQYFENTKYVGIKEKRHLGSEKRTTDQLFNHIPGFSPLPAIAAHMQTEQCLPPFFNWKEVWDSVPSM